MVATLVICLLPTKSKGQQQKEHSKLFWSKEEKGKVYVLCHVGHLQNKLMIQPSFPLGGEEEHQALGCSSTHWQAAPTSGF